MANVFERLLHQFEMRNALLAAQDRPDYDVKRRLLGEIIQLMDVVIEMYEQKENKMDLKELRMKREELEFELGSVIRKFEEETDTEVGANLKYDRYYCADNSEDAPITPRALVDIEIGYNWEDDEETADAATA